MSVESQGQYHEEAYKPGRELKVSAYDNVSGLLVALLILVGFFVTILFIIWLTTRTWWSEQPLPVLIEESSGNEMVQGVADEMEEPGAEEVDELVDPQLKETMEAVTDVASTVAATLEAMQGNSAITGHGHGQGNSRAAGTGGDGLGGIPRFDRWKVKYPPLDEAAYAAMLDNIGLELGCVGGGKSGVDIVSNLSGAPKHRKVDNDDRGYFRQPPESPNRSMDVALFSRAGVNASNRIIVHLCPADVENKIAWAEKNYMDERGKTLQQIKATYLGLRREGGNWEYFVISQEYK